MLCGQSVYEARRRAGRLLAQTWPVEADVVIGIPDSGLDAAWVMRRSRGFPYGVGLVKNRYIGCTFITPDQRSREQAVRIKLGGAAQLCGGERVVMIDDSIVRGTTCRQDHQPAAGGRGEGGPHPGVRAPLHRPMLLWNRYPGPGTAHRPASIP